MNRALKPLDIVNTCGAGDTFCAGLIHSLLSSTDCDKNDDLNTKNYTHNKNENVSAMLSGIQFGMKYAELSLLSPTAVPASVNLQDLLDEVFAAR